jgi:hypothetical protein
VGNWGVLDKSGMSVLFETFQPCSDKLG